MAAPGDRHLVGGERVMSNRVANLSWFIAAGLLLLCLMVATGHVGVLGPDPTCPNYGEVPALIDGEYECIPWEVRP